TVFRAHGDIGSLLGAKLRSTTKLSNGFGIKDGKSSTDFHFYQFRRGVYSRFATYSNMNMRVESLESTQLSQVPGATTCAGPCVECQYLFALQSGVFMPGDWLIAGLFSVSSSGPQQYQPYVCGDIRTSNGPQYTTAMLYALEQVNMGKAPVSVKGVTFGGISLDHCNNEGRANLLTSTVYSNEMFTMGIDEGRILSWLVDNSAATIEAEALLDPLGVAVVSPSASSMELLEYPNFYRTIQGDRTVAMALVKSIKLLGYSYFQVVYSDSAYGEGGLKVLQDVAQAEGICITHSIKVSSTAEADTKIIVDSLVNSETHVVVFFTSTLHTQTVLQEISKSNTARNSLFVLLAEPFDSIVSAVGPLMKYRIMSLRLQSGAALQSYNDYLLNPSFSNPYFAQYYMKLWNCNLPGFSIYSSTCPESLSPITQAPGYTTDNFVLSTINAVYATVDALNRTVRGYCGNSYTEPCRAFLSAPDMREKFNQNLANVNFMDAAGNNFRFLEREGNVAFDLLLSNAQGSYRKVGTYSGVTLNVDSAELAENSNVNSTCTPPCLMCVMRGLNFSHIPGDIYLAAGVFDVHKMSTNPFTCGEINTLHGFLLLEAFQYAIKEISYAAGNPDLSDDRYYPYFHRTVPSDKNMVEAILKFLDMKDIRYVQVVYEDTFNAAATKDYFVEKAASYRICVARSISYEDIRVVNDETATRVVSELMENPAANTVITFLSTELIAPMLQAVDRSSRARGKLRFFGSDDWADNEDAVDGTGQQAINSLSVRLDSDDVEGFEGYINGRNLATVEDNPWFEEYYQVMHNCYLSKANTLGYPQACSPTLSDIITTSGYQQDQGVAYVMDAVYAAAFALHETLKAKWSMFYDSICYAALSEKIQLQKNKCSSWHHCLMGFPFEFSPTLTLLSPLQIGNYNVTSQEVSISPTYVDQVNSNCERKDACSECPLIRDNSRRSYLYATNCNHFRKIDKTIVAFFDIHKQGVDPYRCGPINPEGFQQFLSFVYAWNNVAGSTNKPRVVIIDTCSNSLRVDQDLYGLLAGDGLCNSIFDVSDPPSLANLGAVVTLGEPNTMAAARLLETAGVTYLSPNALSPLLDDHPHLVRSIAPTSAMMKEVASLLQSLGLTYVDMVYENSLEGNQMMSKLEYFTYDARSVAASCYGFYYINKVGCKNNSREIPLNLIIIVIKDIISSGSRAVVLLGSHSFAMRVLQAASSLGIADDYLWILAGPWEPTEENVKLLGVGSDVKIITVQRRTWMVKLFYDYVNTLTFNGSPGDNVFDEWYQEFYQAALDCTASNSLRPL
ncbi:hypothetical protein EGW08_017194, partial [Elysia chlorotica]